ncbi:Hypothetical predicted protein [Cloeon dipterum]|uniref:Uncharacterized protein n=1 Tax=Cloeon dipterum TaxID=197152 RepID=A0A8S1E3S9_9INSE|nr:Hypothetical predicted protein [Cloeon dipterum]
MDLEGQRRSMSCFDKVWGCRSFLEKIFIVSTGILTATTIGLAVSTGVLDAKVQELENIPLTTESTITPSTIATGGTSSTVPPSVTPTLPSTEPSGATPTTPSTEPSGATPTTPSTEPSGATPTLPSTEPSGATPTTPSTEPSGATPTTPSTEPSGATPTRLRVSGALRGATPTTPSTDLPAPSPTIAGVVSNSGAITMVPSTDLQRHHRRRRRTSQRHTDGTVDGPSAITINLPSTDHSPDAITRRCRRRRTSAPSPLAIAGDDGPPRHHLPTVAGDDLPGAITDSADDGPPAITDSADDGPPPAQSPTVPASTDNRHQHKQKLPATTDLSAITDGAVDGSSGTITRRCRDGHSAPSPTLPSTDLGIITDVYRRRTPPSCNSADD